MFPFHFCHRYRFNFNSALKVKGFVFMVRGRDTKKSYDRYMRGTYDMVDGDVPRLDIYKAGLSHYCNPHLSETPSHQPSL